MERLERKVGGILVISTCRAFSFLSCLFDFPFLPNFHRRARERAGAGARALLPIPIQKKKGSFSFHFGSVAWRVGSGWQ